MTKRFRPCVRILCCPAVAAALAGQTPPSVPAPAAQTAAVRPAALPAATKALTPVDKVASMSKSGLGEDLILKAIAKENLKADLRTADLVRLKEAGASDRVILALDTASAAPVPSPSPIPPPAQIAAIPPPAPPAADPKAQQRVAAIDAFDWAAVQTAVQQIFSTNVDIGKGIRALLTKRLQEAGKIRIVERAKIQTVMGEQDFGAGNRVKKGTNSRIGQIRGADVYLMGDIVAFGRDDRNRRVKLGGFPIPHGPWGDIEFGKKEEKSVVVFTYRLVDAETSEVIDTGEARGESSRKSKGIGGMFGWPTGVIGGSVDMTSSNFAQTIIGEATIDACNKMAAIMNEKVPGLPKKQVDVEAYLADVAGSNVTLAAGSNDFVAVGDRFEVFRILSEIKDPISGEVLDKKLEKSGEMVIYSVRDRISSGPYTGAPVAPKTYLARKIQR